MMSGLMSRLPSFYSILFFLMVLGMGTAVGTGSAQGQGTVLPPGREAPEKPQWVEVEVPVEVVNRALRRAGRAPIAPKAGTSTVLMRYEQPVARVWSFAEAAHASDFSLMTHLVPSALSDSKNSDGSIVIAGIDFDQNGSLSGTFNIPADPHGAVGQNHICHVVNVSIQCHLKDGTSVFAESLDSFFSDGDDLFDPRIVYDAREDRFVVLVLSKVDDGTALNDRSEMLLAVSDDGDPAGTWYTQSFNMREIFTVNNESTACWFDYPAVAVDEDALYVTGNFFSFDSQNQDSFCDSWVGIYDKGLYNGGGAESTEIFFGDPNENFGQQDFDSTLQPAQILGTGPPDTTGTWLFQYSGLHDTGTGNDFWLVTRIDDPVSNPSFTSEFVSLGDVDDTSTSIPNAPQPGGTTLVETNDRRALDAVWRDGVLWGTTTVLPPTGDLGGGPNANEATALFAQIDVSVSPMSPIAVEPLGGEDVDAEAHTYFPSVTVDASGNAAFGFTLSSPNTFVGSYLVTRPDGGSLGSTLLAQEGQGHYERTFSGSRNRWGDYSAVRIDPSDGSVWTINKVALTEEASCTSDCGRWGTYLVNFPAGVLPVELTSFEAVADDGGVVLTWETASETNNAGFEVQRRTVEDADAWTQVAFVEGMGTTGEPQRYRHEVDGLAPGAHQFRLKQVDYDGAFEYSPVVEATVALGTAYRLTAPYPNPSSGQAVLELTVEQAQEVRAGLYDALGRRVAVLFDGEVEANAPVRLRPGGERLASGVYVVRVVGETFTAQQKLTLVR